MKLLKTFSLYTFVGFLNAGIGFLVLPVLTHYLSPADYGVISLMNTYVQILLPIIGLSTASYISVEYFNKNLQPGQFKELFSSVRAIPVLVAIPFLIVFALGYKVLPGLMELPAHAYWILLPLALLVLYSENFKSFLVVTKRTWLFSTSTLAKVGFEIPLTLLLVIFIGMDWDGRIYAWFITSLLLTAVSIYYYRKWELFCISLNKTYIYQAIAFGAPLILHQIGKFVINQSDRIFLVKMVSIEEMGVYSVGYQVGMVLSIFSTAFLNFFTPFLFERLNKDSERDRINIVRVSYLFIISMFIILILLTVLTPWLFSTFISRQYSGAAKYVFWVGLSYCFWGIYLIFAGYIYFMKKSRVLGYIAVLNVVINLFCNYFFIKRFGAIGAAYATCLSFFVICCLIAFISQRLYAMPWFSFDKLLKRKL